MPIYPELTHEWAVQRLHEIRADARAYLERWKRAGLEISEDVHYPNFKPEFFYDYSKKHGFSSAYTEFEMHYRYEFDWLTDGLADGDFPMVEEFEWTRAELELAGQLTIYGVDA